MTEKNKDWITGAFETASETLFDILKTPQLTGVHFEFDYRIDECPKIKYEIERLSISQNYILPSKEEEESE